MIFGYCFSTNLGKITIIEEDGCISHLLIDNPSNISYIKKKTKLLLEAKKQVLEYLNGKRKVFHLPLNLKGTPFMIEVWDELQKIPYGKVCSYQDIAKKIHREKASRAVGLANHKNPIPIIIPCHRVIGKNGNLTGYALGIKKKEWLLQLEKENCN